MSTTRVAPTDDLNDCPCAGRNLDRFIQPIVLATLSEGPLHGYRILQRLAAMPMFEAHKPDATGVYRFLKSMEDRDLVKSAWDLSESGPAKRMFDLTPGGRKCLTRWLGTVEQYHRQVADLLAFLRRQSRTIPAAPCGCHKGKTTAGKPLGPRSRRGTRSDS